MLFRCAISTGGATPTYTDFFVAFDGDSLDNEEIFIKPRDIYSSAKSILNISESEGDDFKPIVGIIGPKDSGKVAVISVHQSEGKTDIWWATSDYNPIPGNVENEITPVQNFMPYQNYPNPFNSETTIAYRVNNRAINNISIFDINGRFVTQLESGFKSPGIYTARWNANKK